MSFPVMDRQSQKDRYTIREIVCVTLFTSIPTVSAFFYFLLTPLTCSSVVHFFVPNFLCFVFLKPLICNYGTMLFKDSIESICESPLVLVLVPQKREYISKLYEQLRVMMYTYEARMERVHCPLKKDAKETLRFKDNLFFEAQNLFSHLRGMRRMLKALLCKDTVGYHSTTESHMVSW